MKIMKAWVAVFIGLAVIGASVLVGAQELKETPKHPYKVQHTDAEWKKLLPGESFTVLRRQGTEEAFTGKYWDNHAKGTYYCLGCGLELFKSDTKFNSGTGWPSFWAPVKKGAVDLVLDTSDGMTRMEVRCSQCGGHLGHVFDDGPRPTGLRYCMDSAALNFKPAK